MNTDCPVVSFIRKSNPNFAQTSSNSTAADESSKRKLKPEDNDVDANRSSKHIKSDVEEEEEVEEEVEETPAPTEEVEEEISISVQNGSGVQGAAGEAAGVLRSAGFTV